MKRYFLLIAFIFVFAVTPGLQAQAKRKPAHKPTPKPAIQRLDETPAPGDTPLFKPGPRDADGWNLYESKADLFKAAFPPTPVVTDTLDANGKKDGSRYYNPEPVTPAKMSLTLMVTPLGITTVDADFKRQLYQGWVEGVMTDDGSGKKAVKVSDKEFTFGDSFGMEVIVDREDFRFHGRIICPGSKCYQLAVGSASPGAVKPEEYAQINKWKQKFFDSFQLVKAPAAAPDPFYGKVSNGLYVNDVLKFSLEVPAGWIAAVMEKNPGDADKIKTLLQGDNKYYNKLLDENLKAERMLFRYMRKPVGSQSNASFGVSAQKLEPNKANLEINAAATRNMLMSGNLSPTVEPVQFKFFGKTKAAFLDATTNYNGVQIKQRLYLIHHRGNGISIVLSYVDEMDLLVMEKSVETLKFK